MKLKKMELSDWAFLLISAVGIAVRVYSFGTNPSGLNADEASIGYDAYAVMNYGIDRNGIHNPVQFVAWGSGQNALYGYLSMPFIGLFGLSPFSIRLVNLVLGIVSLFVFYALVKKTTKKEIALAAFFLLAVNPWHIMLSRWALESNIFPAVFMLAVYFLALSPEKRYCLPLSFFVFGVSLYAYGISYFFVPVFLLLALPYMLCHKKIRPANLGLSLAALAITSLPAILFVIVNYFGLDTIVTPFLSIPRLTGVAQFMTQSSIFNTDFIQNAAHNFVFFLRYFVTQEDVIWNVLPKYGFMYLFSLPFALLGLIRLIGHLLEPGRFKRSYIFLAWFSASVLLTFTLEICTNRINIIFFPLIFLVSLGIYRFVNRLESFPAAPAAAVVYIAGYCLLTYRHPSLPAILLFAVPIVIAGVLKVSKKRLEGKGRYGLFRAAVVLLSLAPAAYCVYLDRSVVRPAVLAAGLLVLTVLYAVMGKSRAKMLFIPIFTLYLALFSMFSYEYFTSYPERTGQVFYDSLGEAITYASQSSGGRINVTDKANMPYIFVLFYEKISPELFQRTVKYFNPGASFQNAEAFGRYGFERASPDDGRYSAYVVHNSELGEFDPDEFEIRTFRLYSVALRKEAD